MFKFNDEIVIPFEKCTKIQGFTDLTANISSEKRASGKGVVVLGTSVNERNMVLDFDVEIGSADLMQRYFVAGQMYKLEVDGRRINVIVQDSDLQVHNSMSINPTLSLGLYAPDPYFYDVSDFGRNIAGVVPTFGFPWTSTVDEGFGFSYKMFSDRTIFENKGDTPVGFVVKIKPTGLVTNPQFENLTTGEYVKVNTTIDVGDELVISSVEGDKYIRLNGENIYSKIDRLSDFFYLSRGDNFLKYSADDGATNMQIYLYYSPAYGNGGIQK